MQNRSTGMFATSVPVDVVPSAPRCPSWKIHTTAPNAAVSDNTLSASVLTGNNTLPVSRNISTNVTTPITVSTSGNRAVTASTLSRLTCVTPVICTVPPLGAVIPRMNSSWLSARCENGGAALLTGRNTEASTAPLGADGGPTFSPLMKVPACDDNGP